MVKKKTTPITKSTNILGAQEYKPPVVTVLGHVDHGKTTLLDAIRKTDVAKREHGGITQAIGAYQIEITTKEGKKKITFIDTPGHQAFAKMRGRGVGVCDIALLVVALDDGVMPQTKESIAHITQAGTPFIVVLTKADSQGANPEKVKQQLLKEQVLLEGLGGDVPYIAVSAKTASGIADLLDLILLFAQMKGITADPKAVFEGVIIESKKDRRKGTIATVIVKNGTLSVGDAIVSEKKPGKVRALISDTGSMLKEAVPGMPVEILGFSDVPPVGAKVTKQKEQQQLAEEIITPAPVVTAVETKKDEEQPVKKLPLILKTDTQGSLETILAALQGEDIQVILAGTGEPTEGDVLLARASGAFIVGFNLPISSSVVKLAENEGIIVKTYRLIYELEEEIKEVIALFKQGKAQEVILGKAKVQAVFPYEHKKVAGSKVLEGRMAKGDKVRVERNKEIIAEGRIVSIRQGKEDIGKVEVGGECGILLSVSLDFEPEDVILSVR